MKKIIFVVFSFFLILILTSCDLFNVLTCEHSYELISSAAPTCTDAGYELYKCNKCGREDKNKIAALGHDYLLKSTVESTCSSKGYNLLICDRCQDEKNESLPLVEHAYVVEVVNPTCYSEGHTSNTCNVCGKTEKTNTVDKLDHTFSETIVKPTCTSEGYTIYTCSVCNHAENGNYVDAVKHDLSDWETIKNPTEVSDGIRVRKCNDCDYKETEYIASTSYIDLTYIKDFYDCDKTYDCNTFEEISYIFNLAVVNLASSLVCNIYEFDDFNKLLDDLIENCDAPYSYSINAEFNTNDQTRVLTITFSYLDEPSMKTENVTYIQYDSLNTSINNNIRDDKFDDFKINDSLYSFNVTTTDQLHYALERGAKPIIKEGTNAEIVYEKAKDVLREIVNDDMNDLQKVKAIHDWLVMNVVYDNDLLNMVYVGSNTLKKYNGFYLEGVFLDNKAVCEGISKAFTVLCNIEGIPCVSVEGIQTYNPNGAGHAWNKVYIDGIWYIADATSDGTIIGNEYEVLSYNYFLISEDEYSIKYTETSNTNIICDSKVDIYENMTFTYKGSLYDYVIESQEELNDIVGYLYSGQTGNCTIEFELAFNYGNDLMDEIQTAFRNNNLSASYSYMNNGSIFMLIRK